MKDKLKLLIPVAIMLVGVICLAYSHRSPSAIAELQAQEKYFALIDSMCQGTITRFAGFEGDIFSKRVSCTEFVGDK